MRHLFKRKANTRLGNASAKDVQRHVFFEPLNFEDLAAMKVDPPFKPTLTNDMDDRCVCCS